MSRELGFEIRSAASRDEAVDKVSDALNAEGFIVLTRIEFDQVFREKIGTKFRPYTILGACNPQLAHVVLTTMPELGLMLPFNVTVEADINGSFIRIMNPEIAMQTGTLVKDDRIREVINDATQRLQRVAGALHAL